MSPLFPPSMFAYIYLCSLQVMMGNYDGALDDFARAQSLAPTYAHIYYNRGNLFALLGRLEQAEHDYSTALQLLVCRPSSHFSHSTKFIL